MPGRSNDSTEPRPKRVLLTSGHLGLIHLVQSFLDRRGLRLETADSLAEAQLSMREDRFDLLIVNIPRDCEIEMDFVQWSGKNHPQTEIIVTTTNPSTESAISAFRFGARDYIVDPMHNFEKLSSTMYRTLVKGDSAGRSNPEIIDWKTSHEDFTNIVEKNVDGILIVDETGVTRYVNRSASRYLGFKQPLGDQLRALTESDGLKQIPITRINQEQGIGELSWTSTVWQGKSALMLSIRDITERARTKAELRGKQEQLEMLNSEMSLVEERERRRLANVLHDHVVQNLAFSKIKLGLLNESLTDEKSEQELNSVRESLGQSIKILRNLVLELSPPILYELGLEAALSWYCEELTRKVKLRCSFESTGPTKDLDSALEIVLFQATRELLWNVTKHAIATKAVVHLRREASAIEIEVSDNGIGFQCDDRSQCPQAPRSFGLFSIEQRLRPLRGELRIESTPGLGTKAFLRAPLPYSTEDDIGNPRFASRSVINDCSVLEKGRG